MTTITAVVNTLNEERHIVGCLESLRWADEIVLVDMHSEDRTVELARGITDRIFFHPRTGYVEPARNYAVGQASGDWVLVLDADERVPATLAARLRAVATPEAAFSAVRVPRKNHFLGVWLGQPHFFPDYQTRFFRRGAVTWRDQIHVPPEVQGQVLLLEADPTIALEHLATESLSAAITRLDRYTTVEARHLHEAGVTFDWWEMLSEPARETVRRYFEWGMHRYGFQGLVAASLGWFHGVMVYAKLWEMQGCRSTGDAEIRRLAGRRRALWFLLRRLLRRRRATPAVPAGDRVGL